VAGPLWGPLLYNGAAVVGFLLASVYLCRSMRTVGVPIPRIISVIIGGALVYTYGGAVLPYLVERHSSVEPGPFLDAGRYFHSAFLALLLYAVVVCKALRWPLWGGLDRFMIAAMLMSGVGRLGCYAAGCCEGKPIPWVRQDPYFPTVRYPTQITMFLLEMGIAALLLRLHRRAGYDGQVFWSGVWLYSAYRIGIEVFRTNPPFLLGLTHAQVFSVLTLLAASGILWARREVRPA